VASNNKIGIIVLAIGIVAFFAVAGIAYQKFMMPSEIERVAEDEARAQAPSQAQKRQQQIETAQTISNASVNRQKDIEKQEIRGTWETRLLEGRALLQIKKNTYQIIVVMDNPAASRWYSNGRYELTEDLLMLKPDMKMRPPEAGRVPYRVLTRSNFPVLVSKQGEKLLWRVPGDDADVYVPNYHPFLNLVKDKISVWSVMR
jgi:hypothetical protein